MPRAILGHMAEPRPLAGWAGEPGDVVVWRPTDATRAAVAGAPASDIPPSRQQEQHLRAYRRYHRRGLPMARIITLAWDEPGTCNLPAMTAAITAHLRRHDTYSSRFCFDERDRVTRHQLREPALIDLEPVPSGRCGAAQWHALVEAIPGPLEWDCFGFGIVQHADHFTVFAGIDHLHVDVLVVDLLFRDVHETYTALTTGDTPPTPPTAAAGYQEFCRRQQQELSTLTATSPEVCTWLDFLKRNEGRLPRFPLPLGPDPEGCLSEMVTMPLLDADRTRRFNDRCRAASARPLAGLLACAALTEHALTGATVYCTVTPTTTRRPTDEGTAGWFTGVVPIVLPDTSTGFRELAREAQSAFEAALPLAQVPVESVLELAQAAYAADGCGGQMLSYLDTEQWPMDAATSAAWRRHNGRLMLNRGAAHQIGFWITRTPHGMSLSATFPDDAIARESMTQYTRTLATTVARVADGTLG